MDLDELTARLSPDAQTLLRSLRARVVAVGTVAQRFEPRGAGRGDIVLTQNGAELARIGVRAGAFPTVAIAGAEREVRTLLHASQAGDELRELARQRAAREPQLDLFKRR